MLSFPAKSPFFIRAATLIAAILLGLACLRVVNLWRHEQHPPNAAINKPPSQASKKSNGENPDYSRIAKLHIFGEVTKPAFKSLKKEPIVAPETRLELKLLGIIFNRDAKDGLAIISESGKPQKIFHEGDKLPGDATLYAIEKERVILERNGRQETLTLRKPDTQSNGPSRNNDQPAISRQPDPRPSLVKAND